MKSKPTARGSRWDSRGFAAALIEKAYGIIPGGGGRSAIWVPSASAGGCGPTF